MLGRGWMNDVAVAYDVIAAGSARQRVSETL
jgi:hypothetical protein